MTCFGVYRSRDGAAPALRQGLVSGPAPWSGAAAGASGDERDRDKEVHYDPDAPPGQRITKTVRNGA